MGLKCFKCFEVHLRNVFTFIDVVAGAQEVLRGKGNCILMDGLRGLSLTALAGYGYVD